MSIPEREDFLSRLEIAINRKPTWWNGLTVKDVAQISSFDDLPGDLHGRMIMAMTEDGFSIEEQTRAQKIMEGKWKGKRKL